jgi:hypothetical protein
MKAEYPTGDVFLASPLSSCIGGQSLVVDGGATPVGPFRDPKAKLPNHQRRRGSLSLSGPERNRASAPLETAAAGLLLYTRPSF